LGKTLLINENYDDACIYLEKAKEIRSDSINASILLGKTYKMTGHNKKAISLFSDVLDSDYGDENIAYEIATIYKEERDYKRAVSFIEKAHENGLDEKEYRRELDELYWSMIVDIEDLNAHGRYSEAIDEIERVKKIIPDDDLRLQNTLLGEREIAQHKTKLESRIRSLTFTLTNRCNLKCLMCESRKKTWDLPDKTVEEIKSMMPYLERIMWQGGEAFLFERFEELLDAASAYPIRQVIATNGLLMTPPIAEKLVKYNVELTFSIDGATKEVYEHVRPGANFEKVLEKIRMINELRDKYNPEMPTRLNVLVMKANFKQIEQFLDFAHEYRFTTLFFNSAGCDFKNLSENIFYYSHDPEVLDHLDKIRDRVAKKAMEYGIRLENWLPSEQFFEDYTQAQGEEVLDGVKSYEIPESLETGQIEEDEGEPVSEEDDNNVTKHAEKLFCHAPWQRLYIDMEGKVRPDCLCPVEKDIGNVKEMSLEELWNSPKIIEYRNKVLSDEYQDFCNPDCVYGRVPEKNLKFI
ncbi:radical SAM protein, partial [Elusimicrobiota bacterium]